VARLILDSGAVIAFAGQNPAVRQFVERAIRRHDLVIVPAVVVAETTRGGARDAQVNRVLKRIKITPVTEETARTAGRLLATVTVERSDVTVDALIVAEAVLGGRTVVLTGDPNDLGALAANHPLVLIYSIHDL